MKYEVPLIEENGVVKLKYDVKRGKGVHVHFDIPHGIAIVTSEKAIKSLEKKDVKVVE